MTTSDAEAVRARQNGDYEVPVLAEPVGGPIPEPDPDDEPREADR